MFTSARSQGRGHGAHSESGSVPNLKGTSPHGRSVLDRRRPATVRLVSAERGSRGDKGAEIIGDRSASSRWATKRAVERRLFVACWRVGVMGVA